MREYFSTRSTSGGAARRRWDQVINGTYRGLHIDQLCPDFEAQLLKWRLGGCTLSWPRANGMVLERWHPATGGAHHTIVMHLQHQGSTRLFHRGNTLQLGPGDLAFCAGNEYSRVEASGLHEVLVVEFGLEQIKALVPDIDNRLAVRYPSERPFTRTLHNTLLSFWRDGVPSSSGECQAALETALCSLTAVALTDETEDGDRTRAGSLPARLSASIASRFHDPHLTIGQVAADVGVSTRTIQLTMARIGSTPQKFIRDYRLERALEMLRQHPGRSITDIAYAVGFSDSGYFARCFQNKYGLTPRSYKARN